MDLDLDEQHTILRSGFPPSSLPKLASMGLLGIRIPEEYGGSGMDTTSYAICVEEIARVDGSLALTVASHNGLGTGHVLSFGSDDQKRRYLPKAVERASGSRRGRSPSRAAAATRPPSARRRAATATTGSSTAPRPSSRRVRRRLLRRPRPDERRRCQAARDHGVRRRARDARFTRPSTSQARLPSERHGGAHVDGVRVSDAQRVGESTTASPTRCASSIAGGSRSPRWRSASGTARSRWRRPTPRTGSSSESPSPTFQAIQWMLADSKTELDAAALLTYRAAWLADRGEAALAGEAAMAKLFASEAATRACNSAAPGARRDTATRASSTSSATCATRSSARSARGRARSSASSSPSTPRVAR
jgi:alkylation response protein AidB-like acyl-CoA dehydrogenase